MKLSKLDLVKCLPVIFAFAIAFGSEAKADVYSTCIEEVTMNGIKNSKKIEIDNSVFSYVYAQYHYVGTSDCTGEPKFAKVQYRFDYIAEEMVGHFRSLTLKFPNEERYLNTEIFENEMLLIVSQVYPFYRELDGKWMNNVISLHRTEIERY